MAYEILRKDAHGTPIWLEAVASLEMAKARIFELAQHLPANTSSFTQRHQDVNKIQFNQDVVRRDLEYLDGA